MSDKLKSASEIVKLTKEEEDLLVDGKDLYIFVNEKSKNYFERIEKAIKFRTKSKLIPTYDLKIEEMLKKLSSSLKKFNKFLKNNPNIKPHLLDFILNKENKLDEKLDFEDLKINFIKNKNIFNKEEEMLVNKILLEIDKIFGIGKINSEVKKVEKKVENIMSLKKNTYKHRGERI